MVRQAVCYSRSAVLPFEKTAGVEAADRAPWEPRGMIISEFGDGESSEYECPGCARVFDSERGVKTHYARFCDEAERDSLAGTVVECDECGRRYKMNPAEAKRWGRHFCDKECKGGWQSRELIGEDAPAWKGGKVTVTCVACGAGIQKKPALANAQENHFCDGECYAQTHSAQMAGENNPNYGQRPVECANCGATLMRSESYIHEHNFCDGGCMGEHRSATVTGDDNPNWQGGSEREYGFYWPQQREKARERDSHKCVVCGDGVPELGREPPVHHIVPLVAFDSPRSAHQLGNLITLCPTHHGMAEHGVIHTPTPASPLTPQTLGD